MDRPRLFENLPVGEFLVRPYLTHDGEPLSEEHGGAGALIVPRPMLEECEMAIGLEISRAGCRGLLERNGYHCRATCRQVDTSVRDTAHCPWNARCVSRAVVTDSHILVALTAQFRFIVPPLPASKMLPGLSISRTQRPYGGSELHHRLFALAIERLEFRVNYVSCPRFRTSDH